MSLADEFDGFLVDLDGVVWVGREMVPGSCATLQELLDRGKQLVFVTNNPGKPASTYAERLREAGAGIGEKSIVTAGEVTARLAAAGSERNAFVIGSPAFKATVATTGLELLDGEAAREAGVVLVAGHRDVDYEELLTATLALQRGAKLFATSRDPTLPMPGGAWPGTGAILAAIETATGARAEIGGKPEQHLFEAARERIAGAERVAMIGDRISSDIEGGRRAGLETILVLSGATSREEAESAAPPPDHILESIGDLL
ncbi:MAG TPA: HAD-IIA family hydrolase [Solirubrobacterales bacterium]|jgi:HAD superfamily hydrolase (TIGR01450 family)